MTAISAALFIGIAIGVGIGWHGYKLYLKRLHRMGLYIRKVQRGGQR